MAVCEGMDRGDHSSPQMRTLPTISLSCMPPTTLHPPQVGMDVADAMARSVARAAGMTTMRPLAVVQGRGVGVGVDGGERARASDAVDSSSLDLGA